MTDGATPTTSATSTTHSAAVVVDDSGLTGLTLDHIEFFVADLEATVSDLSAGYGLEVLVPPTRGSRGGDHRSALLGQNRIRLLVTEAISHDHPARAYVERHGDGVADIALRVTDVRTTLAELLAKGAVEVAPPREEDGCVTAAVAGFGDVIHTLVERRPGGSADRLPGLPEPHPLTTEDAVGLLNVDHFAVCLPLGELSPVTSFYTDVFDMPVVFKERIEVGPMGMDSAVVQSRSGEVTFTLIEPMSGARAGQIESFLADHGGAGVQHVAFATDDIAHSVGTMGGRGVPFLSTPATYYDLLTARLTPLRHSVEQLRELSVLVDEDHDGQLFQIFTRSVHPRGTFFFEVIERMRARTFGSNNIRALYEAIELQRAAAKEEGE
ncbi:4-hydroxyphenylpyruvate dioxygenase [Streptomyces sp. ME19-01-6]|uniref:4-hydroxyphenylpyruvate dioxygenase n=1 Tax=Streptomyces sp. ME19-01-6 TaxID=3028686 RepID=UPI0029B4D141|nr:4-hydroxyphenylpyruvate dioxygenase [Streptomyces sp. ME19-01-6]MDX3228149.1 4-hydroxyphenylpyruvate dioxygenase [Streptomyces sp. ME19-01-6]